MKVHVLRLSHRPFRDQRVSTHCGLVARAFGAERIVYSGEKDVGLGNSISEVAKKWGGSFKIGYTRDWRKLIKKYKKEKFLVIHLTIYGLPIQEQIKKIRNSRKNLLVVIGGEKVPPEIYRLSDYNISVTNQPHSEVAALAVFLNAHFKGKELENKFKNARVEVIPQERGKKVLHYK